MYAQTKFQSQPSVNKTRAKAIAIWVWNSVALGATRSRIDLAIPMPIGFVPTKLHALVLLPKLSWSRSNWLDHPFPKSGRPARYQFVGRQLPSHSMSTETSAVSKLSS